MSSNIKHIVEPMFGWLFVAMLILVFLLVLLA